MLNLQSHPPQFICILLKDPPQNLLIGQMVVKFIPFTVFVVVSTFVLEQHEMFQNGGQPFLTRSLESILDTKSTETSEILHLRTMTMIAQRTARALLSCAGNMEVTEFS